MAISKNLRGIGLLPTPTGADTFTGNLKSSQQKDTTKHSVNLTQAFDHPAYVTSLPADFPASHSQTLDLEKERKMTAISGQKCLESFARFPRAGLWARMFADLLIGTGAWYSSRCRLTWKLSAMKSNRLFFQLSPSMLPTDEIGSGLLPTVQAIDGSGPGRPLRMKKDMPRDPRKPGNWRGDLKDHIAMIPTPTARDCKSAKGKTQEQRGRNNGPTLSETGMKTGLILQPNFVEWMMGYPLNWTNLNSPSQNTGQKD